MPLVVAFLCERLALDASRIRSDTLMNQSVILKVSSLFKRLVTYQMLVDNEFFIIHGVWNEVIFKLILSVLHQILLSYMLFLSLFVLFLQFDGLGFSSLDFLSSSLSVEIVFFLLCSSSQSCTQMSIFSIPLTKDC